MSDRKISRCRHSHPHYQKGIIEHHCTVDGWADDLVRICTEEECENCEKFDSRYVEYPLTIQGIDNEPIRERKIGHEIGTPVAVRPCGEEYEGKTYFGIYLGELPISILTSYDRETGILKNSTMNNPAMYVPELKRIIYGCGSWWQEIESASELQEITNADIEDTWYVKLAKELYGEEGK